MMERIDTVEDQVFQLNDGWHCIVAGRVHGVWRDRGAALAGMEAEQWRRAPQWHGELKHAGRVLPCGCTTGGHVCREHAR